MIIESTTSTTTTTRPPVIPLFPNKLRSYQLKAQRVRETASLNARVAQKQSLIGQLQANRTEAQSRAIAAGSQSIRNDLKQTSTTGAEIVNLDPEAARRAAEIADNLFTQAQDEVALIGLERASISAIKVDAVGSFVAPVQPPWSTDDSFGAPRSGHRHEGIDIFADRGTPIVATVDGVLRDIHPTTIGGNIVYLTSPDGTYYYYAHLDSWANGIADGTNVIAGQVLGYLGRTGNAEATPPHLHFEIHPLGGKPIDPYPLVAATHTKDLTSYNRWTIPIDTLCQLDTAERAARAALAAESTVPVTTEPAMFKPKGATIAYPTSTTIAPGACTPPTTTTIPQVASASRKSAKSTRAVTTKKKR